MNNLFLSRFAQLEEFALEGAVVVIKLDGVRALEKNVNIYTVVISRGKLGEEDFYREEGPDVSLLLKNAIDFYCANRKG